MGNTVGSTTANWSRFHEPEDSQENVQLKATLIPSPWRNSDYSFRRDWPCSERSVRALVPAVQSHRGKANQGITDVAPAASPCLTDSRFPAIGR